MINIFSLVDKKVIITGAAGILGKAITTLAVNSGASVVAVDIVEDDRFMNGLKIKGVLPQYVRLDVSDEKQVRDFWESAEAESAYGLVNCAYPRTADWGNIFERIETGSLLKNIEKQMLSVFLWCQLAANAFVKRNAGSIVNIGSMHGVVAPNFHVYEGTQMTSPAGYSLIKGGVIHFTKYLASYYGARNIRVNCVSPGGIRDRQNETFIQNYKKYCPMERLGESEEIAGSVVFLLSDAASYITGHNLIVDGGVTIS